MGKNAGDKDGERSATGHSVEIDAVYRGKCKQHLRCRK